MTYPTCVSATIPSTLRLPWSKTLKEGAFPPSRAEAAAVAFPDSSAFDETASSSPSLESLLLTFSVEGSKQKQIQFHVS